MQNLSHYTYLLTTDSETNPIFYIGARSCKGTPEDDIKYMGSSRLVDFMRTMNISFKKTILHTYITRQEAFDDEQNIFNEMGCIENINCINLNSYLNPYEVGRASKKMKYFKTLFPQLNPGFYVDRFNKIKKSELVFRVAEQQHAWFFINHPEHLKHYYFTTGTKTYWPGREDRLFSDKKGEPRYYITEVEKVDGTPMEQIEQLFTEHFVKGQRAHILETVCEQMLLLDDEDYAIATELLIKNVEGHDDNQFFQMMVMRVKKRRKYQKYYEEKERKRIESPAYQKYLKSEDYEKNQKLKQRLGLS
jgi:hypothetical protein